MLTEDIGKKFISWNIAEFNNPCDTCTVLHRSQETQLIAVDTNKENTKLGKILTNN